MNETSCKLRDWACRTVGVHSPMLKKACLEGAAEIDRLEAVNAKLLAACKAVVTEANARGNHHGSVALSMELVCVAIDEAERKQP